MLWIAPAVAGVTVIATVRASDYTDDAPPASDSEDGHRGSLARLADVQD
jgi:hypothetical protein